MTRLRMIIGEAWRSITASMSTTVAATMTVLVAMLVLGTTIGLGTWVLSYSDHLKQQLLVKVYFKNDRTAQQINAIGRRFDPKVNPLVEKLTFVSKEEALKIMQKRLPQLNKGLAYNPYPDAYEIRPTKGEYINDIRNQLRPIPAGVDRVNDGGSTSHRVLKVGGIISVVCLIGVLLLLIASTLLIANTIRLSIFARRREIEVMKLVGATNWFVRGPFMVEGLICGLAGSIAAVVLLVVGKAVVLPSIGLHHSKDAHAMAFELNALILIGIGLALGVSGTGLTLRRFLQV
ncbi:MAG TPA: permease-like cell division protein FtsX [Gaiellaceae bacterium]|jgi:cell division transport system permease protein